MVPTDKLKTDIQWGVSDCGKSHIIVNVSEPEREKGHANAEGREEPVGWTETVTDTHPRQLKHVCICS